MTANDDTTAHWGLPAFTGALLATFVAYMVAWYLGIVAGNFSHLAHHAAATVLSLTPVDNDR